MSLKLYNSMSREIEEFKPVKEGHVGMYVCGPTVYGPPHLGHAKSYITFDILAKFLRISGYNVRYVQNITDVGHLTDDADEGEDKIERQARIDMVHPWEIVDKWTRQYMLDMERLGIAHPSFYVRASQHIPEQIHAIKELIDAGHAYEVNGSVYYSVESFPEYGKLSGNKLEEQKDGVRISVNTDKKHPGDFALWKKAEPEHILKWDSPWSKGYPGWHIECSVMANKYLGLNFDIHGGGLENKFPHHECEIAQSEAIHKVPFCNYWVHNNMITVDGIKMGKSLGNFITCEDLLSRHSKQAIRAFLLSTHYSSPSNYTEEAIEGMATGVARLDHLNRRAHEIAVQGKEEGSGDKNLLEICEKADKDINDCMNNNLDTPGSIAILYSCTSEVNKLFDGGQIGKKGAVAVISLLEKWADGLLGILPAYEEESYGVDLEPIMSLVLDIRSEMKKNKNYAVADKIRDELHKAGILVEDTKDGARWRKA